MYLPLTYAQANHPIQGNPGLSGYRASRGLGEFDPISPALQVSEFYPPPYDFLAAGSTPSAASAMRTRAMRGAMRGMGLFDSMDFTTWGFPEWLTIGAVLYFSSKILGDAQKVTRKVRSVRARSRRRRKMAAEENASAF